MRLDIVGVQHVVRVAFAVGLRLGCSVRLPRAINYELSRW